MNSKQAIVLFAHGARDPRWAEPFEAIAQGVRALRPSAHVQLAFLEFMQPTLTDAAEQAVMSGARQVAVVPLFLGAGGHVRKDLPALMEALRQRHPSVGFHLEPAIGERASVVQAMAHAAVEGLGP